MKICKELNWTISPRHKLITAEPMHCWRLGCKEEFNGLMCCELDYGCGFVFALWLCHDCYQSFKKLGGKNKLERKE